MLPRKFFEKNGVIRQIWCNLGRPKVCYYQPKNQQFEGKKINKKTFIAIFLSQINLDEHVSTKTNTFRIYKGGVSQKQKKFKKKSNKMEAFPYFLAVRQGSLYPQNYELAP